MAYASFEQWEILGPSSKAFSSFSQEKIEAFLEVASNLIDSYLANQYELPLTFPFDLSIVQACISIAVYNLLLSRGINPNNDNDQLYANDYESKISWLTKLSTGKISINNKSNSPNNLLGKPFIIYPS